MRYLPIYELLLAKAISDGKIAEEIKIFTLWKNEKPERYFSQWEDSDIFIFWEYFSTKAPHYVHSYIKAAPVLKHRFKKPVYFGGFWATSYGRYFKEFQVFDKIFEGYSIDSITRVLSSEDRSADGNQTRYVDVKGNSDFDKYPLDLFYLATPEKYYSRKNKALFGYMTTFSCPRNCKFCFANSARNCGSGYNARSLETVKNDIDTLTRFFDFKRLVLKDLNFFSDDKRAFRILDYLAEKEINISINLDITLTDIKESLLVRLKEYGIVEDLYFGLESFDPGNRKKVGKPFTDEQLDNAFGLVEKHGFSLVGNIIVGFPWQTIASIKEEIAQSIHYINRYGDLFIMMNAYKPEYGTDIQKKYFPTIHERINFSDLVAIYLNKVSRYQDRVYGEQFKKLNIEYIFNIMRLINNCKRFEKKATWPGRKYFFYLRKLLERIVKHTLLPGPVTRLMLNRQWVQILIRKVFPIISRRIW